MKIGNLELKHGLILAPMAGFTDSAMRRVCYERGAEYTVTEMVSAKAVVYRDRKTAALARIDGREGPVGLQLFGSEPEVVAEAAALLSGGVTGGSAPVTIDINMGCPVHKIFSNGEGSALMRSPSLIHDIVRATTRSISLPVTVKLRLGIDRGSLNAVECALAAEEGGAAMVCVHGRTRVEMYAGQADMESIANVKSALHIPLVANGDVTNVESALRALRLTGADGIAVGRGALGNPFVFSEIRAALSGESFAPPTLDERIECALYQLSLAILDKGEERAVREARGQISLYFKGFRGAAELRGEINRAETLDDVKRAIEANLLK